MKYSTVAVFTAFVAGAAAQLGLAPCPSACIFQGGASTACKITDIACTCRDLAYQAQLAECVGKCAPEEAAKAAEVGAQICKEAGVEITVPSITSTVPAPTSVVTPSTTPGAISETPAATTTTPAGTASETPASTIPTPAETAAPTTLISSIIASAGRPVPTGNATTNGTITPPINTGIPTPGEEGGAARVALGSLMGVVVLGAVVLAL